MTDLNLNISQGKRHSKPHKRGRRPTSTTELACRASLACSFSTFPCGKIQPQGREKANDRLRHVSAYQPSTGSNSSPSTRIFGHHPSRKQTNQSPACGKGCDAAPAFFARKHSRKDEIQRTVHGVPLITPLSLVREVWGCQLQS